MKTKMVIGVLVLGMLSVLGFAGVDEFSEGSWFVTPQLAFYSYAANFGASAEYGLTENIGVGATLMMAFWKERPGEVRVSQSLITPSIDGYYHFTAIEAAKLDVFAGASLGYSIYSWSWNLPGDWASAEGSEFFLAPFAGARYYFTNKIAAYLNLRFSLIGWSSGIGPVIGITFRIK